MIPRGTDAVFVVAGTFEPELMFEIAARNGLESGYSSLEEAHAARNFGDLQSFLDIYYAACSVVRPDTVPACRNVPYKRCCHSTIRHAL